MPTWYIHALIIALAIAVQLVNWLLYQLTRAAARQHADPDEREFLLEHPYRAFFFTLFFFGAMSLFQVARQLGILLAGGGVDANDVIWLIGLLVTIPVMVLVSRRDRRALLHHR